MRTRHFLLTSAVMLIFGAPLLAQERDGNRDSRDQASRSQSNRGEIESGQQLIDKYDDNGDGQLSREELPRDLRQSFSQLDRNDNGRLSVSELRNHGRRMMRQAVPVEITYIWLADTNAGNISLSDLQQAYQCLQQVDENGDGKLTREELRQRREELAQKWADKVIARLDDNSDDKISQSEAEDSFLASGFDRYDANGNGAVSASELEQFMVEQTAMSDSREQTARGSSRDDDRYSDRRQADRRSSDARQSD